MANNKKDMDKMLTEAMKMFGFKVTFTPESLLDLERKVYELYPNGPELHTTGIPFGWYLGEVIVRNIPGAKWVEKPNLFEWEILVPVKMQLENKMQEVTASAMPFVRISKFFSDPTDGLKVFFDGLNLANLGMMPADLDKAPVGEWGKFKELPNGNSFRMMMVKNKEE